MSVVYSFCSRFVFLAIFISNIYIFVNNLFLMADHRLIPALLFVSLIGFLRIKKAFIVPSIISKCFSKKL